MCDRKTISYHTVLILACLASNPKRMLTLGASSPRGAEAGTRSENNYLGGPIIVQGQNHPLEALVIL